MRIAISLVLLFDLIIRATALTAHYTSEGVLPVDLLLEFDPKAWRWSFHYLNDSFAYEAFLFILNAIIVFFLLIGYRTKLFTFLSWAFLVSLQNRNPFILQSGDDLLRMVLFWAIFLPWGHYYSLDAKYLKTNFTKTFSIASIGYLILIVSVYLFSAIYKNSPEWQTEGTAVYYALSLDQLRIGLGDWLYQYPTLMKYLTFLIYYYFELVAPILILLPLKNKFWRALGVISIILLHVGIASTLYVGLFAVIGISSTLGLVPYSYINKIRNKFLKFNPKAISPVFHKPKNKFISIVVGCFLLFVIGFNLLGNLGNIPSFKYGIDERMEKFNNLFKLEQFWGMFSPHIYKTDGWYIYRGIKPNDSIWDIYNNKPGLDYSKPKDIDKMYTTDRWRKLAENFEKNTFNFMRPYYCRYLIKEWNKNNPNNKIEGLNIIYLMEESLPEYKTIPIKEQNICLCYENELVQ